MFSDSTILITGGTGTIGDILVKHFINQDIRKLKVYSRDENKLLESSKKYNSDKVEFIPGDILDYDKLVYNLRDVEYVIHTAAMKHIVQCEQHPLETIKTNVIGTDNVLKASILNKVNKVCVVSSDKAVYPSSTYGYSKYIMESICTKTSALSDTTSIVVVRPCNLLCSMNNVTSIFMNQLSKNQPITVCKGMSRYFITSQQILDMILYSLEKGKDKEIIIKNNLKQCSIEILASTMIDLSGHNRVHIEYIEKNDIEKVHEDLLTTEEYDKSFVDGEYIVISNNQNRGIVSDYTSSSVKNINIDKDSFLSIAEVSGMLLSEDIIREWLGK